MRFHGLGLTAIIALWVGCIAGAAIPGSANAEAIELADRSTIRNADIALGSSLDAASEAANAITKNSVDSNGEVIGTEAEVKARDDVSADNVNAILRFYRDSQYRGQWWYGGADDAMDRCFAAPCGDCISSIQFTGDSHRASWCLFWDGYNCVSNNDPLYATQNLGNLGPWNYNDKIKSFKCMWS
ncbi:hypothetical protein BU16DRAFT_564012 [Lophium mytilinum]|uniref:Uncharacterized protein n=1 Tax=Lophium mytilinum TaxID=390894 RepID=A0A6A6QKW5_9PEZI|nr:hypothetical protein BU16DRAFT_564012 [Lophium mytilinum]